VIAKYFALAACLGGIAFLSPPPDRVTDRGVYEATAHDRIVPDCSDLHCFRVLVPWALGPLPGSSDLKWKAYAVVCNASAAVAVFALCLTFGLSRRAAAFALAASAFGFGSLYTLHDPYTSDPLMFLLGPVITDQLLRGRVVIGAAIGAAGVLAKEFAAAPLYIVAAYHASGHRWLAAARALAAGNAVFIVWALLLLTLMLKYNYSLGGTESANFAGGAAIAPWLQRLSSRGAALAMFNEFGAMWLLIPIGGLMAPPGLRRLTLVSLPVAAVFAYVQQPDRALWNFHFLVLPLAAIVLERAPEALAWSTLAAYGIGNLRVGAQLPIPGGSRIVMAVSVLLAAACAVSAVRAGAGERRTAVASAFRRTSTSG
jgi:hypothetical protein